jgi:predicted RNA-binding protein with RPS1 domain
MDILTHFRTIEELTKTLSREHVLLSQMFEKRKLMKFPQGLALELVGGNEKRLRRLVDYGVLVENGNAVEIESDYLNFFEEVLNVNEEISVLSVQECINTLKEHIGYFLQESNVNRKASYQDSVRQLLKKTGFRTLKNVVDLKRNMDNAYKQEPNYAIKKKKLQNLDEKGHSIRAMIRECEKLMDTEQAFFLMANDPHMAKTCSDVKHDFVEAYHALMEIDRQIIVYINQIDQQNQLYKKIRKLKYLQDQLLIKTDTSLVQVLEEMNPLWMEPRQYSRIRLSLDMLRENDQILKILRRIAERNGIQRTARTEAEPLTDDDLQAHVQNLKEVDPDEVWNAFAASSYHLFDFILRYDYKSKRSIEDHAALFCQLVILHTDDCRISGKYATYQDIEYPIIYAK